MTPTHAVELHDVDRRIWQDELDEFVPQSVYDVHTHLYRWEHNLDPEKETSAYAKFVGDRWREVTCDTADGVDAALFPGRRVARLAFPFPFPKCAFDEADAHVARYSQGNPASASLMLAYPGLSVEAAEAELERHGHIGFKPYRFYSATGDAVECRLTDFMPESLIALADRRGLAIMMHLSKRDAIADADNQRDLLDLSQKYPNVRWILAHCARSYSFWPVERAAATLKQLHNAWYDTSSVCESDAIEALMNTVGPERVMYGSDDVPVGVLRGKYIAFGFAWAYLSEANQSLSLVHCDGRMTFTRYEQLRATRRAAKRLGLTREQIAAHFHDTAANLVAGCRAGKRLTKDVS
jgi:glutamate-1-semialdehyde 2,1-aminomutase